MKRSGSCVLAALTLLLIFSATLQSSVATDYSKIGVKTGDNWEYSEQPPSGAAYTMKIVVDNVYMTNVTMTTTMGLMRIQHTDNISLGYWCEVLIVADLSVGDLVGLAPMWAGYRINGTIEKATAGEVRSCIWLDYRGGNFLEYGVWDRSTGLCVEFDRWIDGSGWTNKTLTYTSIWGPQPLSPLLLIVGIGGAVTAIVVVLAVVVLRRRRK